MVIWYDGLLDHFHNIIFMVIWHDGLLHHFIFMVIWNERLAGMRDCSIDPPW